MKILTGLVYQPTRGSQCVLFPVSRYRSYSISYFSVLPIPSLVPSLFLPLVLSTAPLTLPSFAILSCVTSPHLCCFNSAFPSFRTVQSSAISTVNCLCFVFLSAFLVFSDYFSFCGHLDLDVAGRRSCDFQINHAKGDYINRLFVSGVYFCFLFRKTLNLLFPMGYDLQAT